MASENIVRLLDAAPTLKNLLGASGWGNGSVMLRRGMPSGRIFQFYTENPERYPNSDGRFFAAFTEGERSWTYGKHGETWADFQARVGSQQFYLVTRVHCRDRTERRTTVIYCAG